MKFKTQLQKEPKHSELVCSVNWAGPDEIISCGDDRLIVKWNLMTNESTVISTLPEDVYPTDSHMFPRGAGGKKPGSDVVVIATSDGKFILMSMAGRVEKTVSAHHGAVLSIRWSPTGADLLTAGEDGVLKIWSRSGMLRSTLAQTNSPIYTVAWSADSEQVIHTQGKQLTIKPIQPNSKPTTWKAHEGVVLSVDWSIVNNHIVSGGEDCRYKVWDNYGRLLFSSSQHDYPITSVGWSPSGELLAVGAFNTLRLCDVSGWSYSLDKPHTGSIMALGWSSDSTQVAGACGNGQVLFGHVIDRRLEWKNFEVVVTGRKNINVRNVSNDAKEKLDFRDRVIKVSIGYKHLIVTTSSQCYIYNVRNWNTPMIIDLKEGSVTLIVQSEKHFALVDSTNLSIYSYDGRLVCQPRFPGMQPSVINERTLALSDDTIAIRDRADERAIHLFETTTGKLVGEGKPFQHELDVMSVALDQCRGPSDRHLAFTDTKGDLFVTRARTVGTGGVTSAARRRLYKLGTMVQSMAWCDENNMLGAMSDGKLTVWYCPQAAFVDKDLVSLTVSSRDASEFGRAPQIVAFLGPHIVIRLMDGSLVTTFVWPYPGILHSYIATAKWEDAVRLCRFVNTESLWACLAALSMQAKELNTAEICYAAIGEADKVQFIQQTKEAPLKEVQNAQMALLCNQTQEAEGVLLQAGLTFRAIMLNMDLHNWERALELAVKHKTHVDTVLAFRQQYLEDSGRKENDKRFLQYAEGLTVDMEKIQAKIDMEYEQERQRPSTQTVRSSTATSQAPSNRRTTKAAT